MLFEYKTRSQCTCTGICAYVVDQRGTYFILTFCRRSLAFKLYLFLANLESKLFIMQTIISLIDGRERMENWLGTILNQFQMSKENWTESGFEPETSGLTYQHSTNWAIQPYVGGSPNCQLSLLRVGCQSEAINPEMPCSRGSSPLEYDTNNEPL